MKSIAQKIIGILVLTILITGAVGVTITITMPAAHAQTAADAGKPAAAAKPTDAKPAADAGKPAAAAKPTDAKPAAGASTDAAVQGLGDTQIGSVLQSSDIIVQLAKILAVVLRVISQILWPLLMLGGGLMKSDFLYTGLIDMKLTDLWIQMRNLVNIIYVILLIVVALYNVLGLGEMVSMLEIKKALPKIILGLILVNFSYTGVKVVLDVVNAGTAFAFSLPRTDPTLMADVQKEMLAARENICGQLVNEGAQLAETLEKSKEVKDADAAAAAAKAAAAKKGKKPAKGKTGATDTTSGGVDASSTGGICVKEKYKDGSSRMVPNKAIYDVLQNWNMDGSLAIMAVKFMRLQNLSSVADTVKTGGIAGLTINMLLSLAMYLIYGVSFIVLIIVLFARAAILWMVIVFSPLIVLNLTFPNLLQGVGSGLSGKITKTLLAPIIIGFVLSIGFIIMSTLQMYNFGTAATIATDTPSASFDTFQDILIAIGSVVFVWLGVEAAIDGTIANGVAGTVMSGAKSVGTWLAKAPFFYTPLFQIKSPHSTHGEMVDLGTIMAGLQGVEQSMRSAKQNKADEIFGLRGTLNLDNIKTTEDLKVRLKGVSLDNVFSDPAAKKKMHEALKTAQTRDRTNFNKDTNLQNALAAFNKGDDAAARTHLENYQRTLGGATPQEGAAGTAGRKGAAAGVDAAKPATAAESKKAAEEAEKYLNAEQKGALAGVKAAKTDAEAAKAMESDGAKKAMGAAKKAMEARDGIAKDASASAYAKAGGTVPDAEKGKMKELLKAKLAEMKAAGVDEEAQATVIADAFKDATKGDTSKRAQIVTHIDADISNDIGGTDAIRRKVKAEIIKP